MKKNLLVSILLSFGLPSFVEAQETNPLRDSLKVAAEVLAYHPDSVDLLLKKAAWNIVLEQWQYAKDSYDIVLAKEPTNIAALYFRAYANERLNRFNFARLDYEHLLSIVPGNYQAQLGLALLNHKSKHYTEAMDMMNHLATQFPDSAVVFAARANMEKDRKMYSVAEYDITKAINLDPKNVEYLLSRADLRIKLCLWPDAKADLKKLPDLGVPASSLNDMFVSVKKRRNKQSR